MNTKKKKALAVFLLGSMALGVTWFASPRTVSAQNVSDSAIEAEIQAIYAAIAQIEAQYGLSVPGIAVPPAEGGSTGIGIGSGNGSGNNAGNVLLNINANPSVSSGTIVPGTANQRIASFVVTNVSNRMVTLPAANGIQVNPGANPGAYLNLRVYANGSLYGSQSGVSPSDETYTIAGANALTIAAGASATIDIYADVSATAPLGIANQASLYLNVPGALSSSIVYGQTMTTSETAGSTGVLGASTTAPSIASINPTSGGTGISLTLTGSGFGATTTVLMNGQVAAQSVAATANGTSLRFVLPISLEQGCVVKASSVVSCSQPAMLEAPGTYQVTVVVNGIQSNAIPFQLTSNPYYNPL